MKFIKTGILLLGVSVLLWNCEKEETLEAPLEKNILETISITKAKELFEEFNKQKNNLLSKGSKEQFEFEPLWETIKQEALSFSDAQLTNLDIKPKVKLNYKPKLFFIKINGYNIKAFETTIAEEVYNTGKIKKGVVYYHSIEGDFMTGYRVKNGRIVTRLKQKQKLNKAGFLSFFFQECSGTEINIGDLNGGCFDEVMVYGSLETMEEFMSVYNTSGNFYPTESNTNGGSGDGIVDNGGGGGGNGDSATNSVQIDDTSLKPCMQTIVTDIKTLTNDVKGIITRFSGSASGYYNWRLKDSGITTGSTAQTSIVYNATRREVTTNFDTNQWSDASDLSWARTILHESIHAYVIAVQYNTSNAAERAVLLGPNWRTRFLNQGHDFIANNYIAPLADALQEFGVKQGYNLNRSFYEDMVWGGLNGTDAFNNYQYKDRALNIIAVELTKKDLNGTTKTQKGQDAGC